MNSKPCNIVFYFSDQQRWDTLGCYGQKLPVTPVLDKLPKKAQNLSIHSRAIQCVVPHEHACKAACMQHKQDAIGMILSCRCI